MRGRGLVVVFALGGIAVLVLAMSLWRNGDDAAKVVPSAARRASEDRAAPVLEGTGPKHSTDGRATPSPSPERPAFPDGPSAGGSGTHVLRGRLVGLDPTHPEPAQVRVEALRTDGRPSKPVAAPAATGGSFELDVSSLFADEAPVIYLDVEADHPRHARAKARVRVERESTERRPRVFTVEIPLVRAARLRGLVLGPGRAPVAGASVGAFELDDEGVRAAPVESGKSEPDGRWSLRVGSSGRMLVVAAAAGRLPAAREVSPVGGEDLDVGILELREGTTLTGTVRFRGTPAPGAELRLRFTRDNGTRLSLEPPVVWTPQGVLSSQGDATADSRGRYAFTGLSPGSAVLSARDLPVPADHLALGKAADREVTVPASGVDLDLDGVVLTIAVLSEGRPFPNAMIVVSLQGVVAASTDETGEFSLLAPHGAEGEVRVAIAGFEPVVRKLQAPPTGEEQRIEIDLEARRARSEIVLRLEPPGGHPIAAAGVALLPPDATSDWPSDVRDLKGEGSLFRFEAPPGRHRLRVRPGGPWHGGSSYWIEEQAVVDVPLAGEVEVVLPARTGGRLRITARGEGERPLSAHCTVRRADGTPVPVYFVSRVQGGASVSGGGTHGGTADDVDPPLEAGAYSVSFEKDGYASRSVPVRVEAGRTTDVDVTLEAVR